MRNRVKEDSQGRGFIYGISGLLMMGYGMGSPDVAPLLPPQLERPFVNLHRDLYTLGEQTARSAATTIQRLADLASG